MEITNRFIQAYRQAPWRVQLQWAGAFLLVLVIGVLVAAVYLNISAQAATAGLEAQDLEYMREATQRRIADLKTKMAVLTSQDVMVKRAEDMGFVDDDPSSTTYIVVQNYPGRQAVVLAPPPSADPISHTIIKPGYTQSLWEWMFQGILTFSKNNEGAIK